MLDKKSAINQLVKEGYSVANATDVVERYLATDVIRKLADKFKDNSTPAQQLATALHKKLCHWNHTDGCAWYYETWDKPYNNTRKEYLKKAEKILKIVDIDTTLKIVEAL